MLKETSWRCFSFPNFKSNVHCCHILPAVVCCGISLCLGGARRRKWLPGTDGTVRHCTGGDEAYSTPAEPLCFINLFYPVLSWGIFTLENILAFCAGIYPYGLLRRTGTGRCRYLQK